MAFEAKLSLRQTQKMVMTPMLQQAISLLQLSRLEMLQALHQELEENPILEEVTEGIEELEDVPDVNAVGEEPTPESNGEGSAPEIDWESYLQDASDYRPSVRREEIERFDSESLLTRPGSLQDRPPRATERGPPQKSIGRAISRTPLIIALLSDARRSSGSIARACSPDPAHCRTTSFSSSI